MRLVLHLSGLGLCLLLTRVAQSSTAVTPSRATEAPRAPPAVEYDDYRMALVGVDIVSISMLIGAPFVENDTASTALVIAGFGGYGLGGPAVHLSHEQPSRALGSFGLRVGLPLGGIVGGFLLSVTCPHSHTRTCEQNTLGIGLVFSGLGALTAMIIDDAFLGYAPKATYEYEAQGPSSFRIAVAPLFDPRRKTRGLSFVGVF